MKHFLKNKKNAGKFIVVDGIDGSGKATQVAFLEKNLKKEGLKVKTIDFPRYYNNFFGKFISECLSGKHGDFIKTDPRVVSVLYAADRFESSGQVKEWINKGFWVIADRYVSANQIHQGGKIRNIKERKCFINWLEEMEHGVFGLPYPDLVLYLDVTLKISEELLGKKETQKTKRYLRGQKDLAENDLEYLKNSRNTALSLEKKNKNWKKIICYTKDRCLPPEEVSEKIFEVLKKEFGL